MSLGARQSHGAMLSRSLFVSPSGRPPPAAVRIAMRAVPARRVSARSGGEHGPIEAISGSAAEEIRGALEEDWVADLEDDSIDWAGGEEDEDPGSEEGEAGGWGRPVEDLDDDVSDGLPPVLVIAGFFLEELAGVRALLDQVGGQGIALVPSTPELLRAPLGYVLKVEEPAWDKPMPVSWKHGGGWGAQRIVLMSGMGLRAQVAVIELMLNSRMGQMAFVTQGLQDLDVPLGEVLARGLQRQRDSRAGASDWSADGTLAALEGEMREELLRQEAGDANSTDLDGVPAPDDSSGLDDRMAALDRKFRRELLRQAGGPDGAVPDSATAAPAGSDVSAEGGSSAVHAARAAREEGPEQPAAASSPPAETGGARRLKGTVSSSQPASQAPAGLDLIDRIAAGGVLSGHELVPPPGSDRPAEGMSDPLLSVFNMLTADQEAEPGASDPEGGNGELPGAEDFVMNTAQLRQITDKYGLDYESLLESMKAQGVELSESEGQ